MALPISIRGSNDGHHEVHVTSDGGLLVATYPADIKDLTDQASVRRYYQGFLVDLTGSNQAAVNGVTQAVIFSLGADSAMLGTTPVQRAKAINRLRFLMQSSNLNPATAAELRRFGTVAAPGLVNGMQVVINQGSVQTNLFPASVNTLWDMFQISDAVRSYPNAIAVGIDALILDVVFTDPVVIGFGSGDSIQLIIQDNLSGFTSFQVLATGRYELATD